MEAKTCAYYEQNWPTIIMDILGYKNPLVVNAHKITGLSTLVDKSSPVYFFIERVKPGRHFFTIEHDEGGEITD